MHKPVLVTGASSGIGEAIALELAGKGFKVYAAARRTDRLRALAQGSAGCILPLEMDVTDEGSIAAALREISANADVVYGLINNAGVSVIGPVERVPANEWRRVYETNVFGPVNVARAVLPQMRAAGAGRIVNIGSIAGRIVAPFFGVYGSSKHAVEGVSDALRRELRPHGIRVSLIRPGFINTPFGAQEQASIASYMEEGDPYYDQLRIFRDWHAKGHPNARPPGVVAEKVLHALTAEKPHSRYTVPASNIAPLMLRNLAPSALVDRVFERVTGLHKLKGGAP